jgi:outer membrane immunogenic protein
MHVLRLAVAVIAVAVAVPSLAANVPIPRKAPPAAVSVRDWTGPYAGLVGGYAWGESEQFSTLVAASTGPYDISGPQLGATLGYNRQAGALMFGIEGDISWAAIKGATSSTATWDCVVVNGCQTDIKWFGTLRGRVGLPMDAWMPYLTAGLAYGAINVLIVNCGCNATVTRAGWVWGAGVEFWLRGSWTGKLEALHVDFGDFFWNNFAGIPGLARASFTTIRVGANFSF